MIGPEPIILSFQKARLIGSRIDGSRFSTTSYILWSQKLCSSFPDLIELPLVLLETCRYSAKSDENAGGSGAMDGAAREPKSSCQRLSNIEVFEGDDLFQKT